MSTITTLANLLTHPKKLKSLLSFGGKGYLHEIGWFKAFESQSPVDAEGRPIPWVTYSFIDFIEGRLTKKQSVFEFGSGNSTYFYAKLAGKVVSVEHDKAWYNKIKNSEKRTKNSEIIYCELHRDGEYSRKPVELGTKFDIIIVDGRDRVNCCKHAVDALTPTGVVVLDDSERDHYKEGVSFLLGQDFKQLSFTGISPGLFYNKATSVFYKADNCLGI